MSNYIEQKTEWLFIGDLILINLSQYKGPQLIDAALIV